MRGRPRDFTRFSSRFVQQLPTVIKVPEEKAGAKKGEEPGRDEEIGFSTPPHSSHWSLQQSSHYNTSENSQVVKIASFLNRKTHRGPICLLSPCRLRAFEQINF